VIFICKKSWTLKSKDPSDKFFLSAYAPYSGAFASLELTLSAFGEDGRMEILNEIFGWFLKQVGCENFFSQNTPFPSPPPTLFLPPLPHTPSPPSLSPPPPHRNPQKKAENKTLLRSSRRTLQTLPSPSHSLRSCDWLLRSQYSVLFFRDIFEKSLGRVPRENKRGIPSKPRKGVVRKKSSKKNVKKCFGGIVKGEREGILC